MSYPIGPNESARLATLRDLRILGTDYEVHFDAVCRTAAALFNVPIALVSLVEEDHQWFKAHCGLDARQTSRDVSFCNYAILGEECLVVVDAGKDERFRDNALVTGAPHIRFYAGAPLEMDEGLRVGTLCVIDRVPRTFSAEQQRQLTDLAAVVVAHLRQHALQAEAERRCAEQERVKDALVRQRVELDLSAARLMSSETLLRTTLENMDQGLLMVDGSGIVQVCNEKAIRLLDLPPAMMRAKPAFAHVIAHQNGTGEFAGAAAEKDEWLKLKTDLLGAPPVYERVRPDGTVLEIRTVRLPNGGAVRTFTDLTTRKRNEAALAESEARYRALSDALPQMVWVMRVSDGRAIYRNEGFINFYGEIGVERTERVARNHPDDTIRIEADWRSACATGQRFEVEGRLRRHDGVYRWHKLVMDPVRRDGEIVEWIGTALDIDDIVRDREFLERTTALIRSAQEGAGAGLFDWNLETGEALLSQESLALFGLPVTRNPVVASGEWEHVIDPRDMPDIVGEVERAARTGTAYRAEFRLRHADGGERWTLGVGRVNVDETGRPRRIVGLNLDITDRKRAEHAAEHRARHDALTELPNRVLFNERLKHAIATARRRRRHAEFALLLLDLDRFKVVNDTLGHQAGDRLLRMAAERMRALVREEDTLARLGGDEFAIIQTGPEQPQAAQALAERLVAAMTKPFIVGGQVISIGLSIGIAVAPRDGLGIDELSRHADLALYRSKQTGRNTYQFYEPAMDAAHRERQVLEVDLRQALVRAEFDLHYQPQMNVTSGEITGFEALVRWNHPKRGMVSPAAFIPVAEETKLISPIGEWVLRRACQDAASWPVQASVSVNVSAIQFGQPGLVQGVMSALAASSLPPQRLELEVTETVLIHEGEALQTLHQLRALGVRIALDDFGTGYSSLAYLRRFPFDKLKIDRSFIREIDNPDTAAIVRAMVGLGQRLGMTITAEGVETPDQLERVMAEGCTEAQGYLISPPKPIYDALAVLFARTGGVAA